MSSADFRNNLLAHLRLLASGAAQLAYEQELADGPGWAPWELIDGWSDMYVPGYEMFDNAFTADEHEALASFNRLLKAVAKDVPDESVKAMLDHPDWQRIMAAANQRLQLIGNGRDPV